MADQCQSDADKDEDQNEHKEQDCSGRKREGEELHEGEGRRVLQKVSSPDASSSGSSGIGETGQRSEAVHKDEQSTCGSQLKYDVFLNHRGPDLKKTFVSHLDAALRRGGCDPFLDKTSLVKGQHAFKSINEALCGAQVHVAVFSPGYAVSKYCLDELCDMLASKKALIPVYYNVEPENLRWVENRNGPFAEAFSHHIVRGRDEDAVRWRRALGEVANITGFRLVDFDNEMELVEKVVLAVMEALPAPPPLAFVRHPVGLKETSAHVVNMLQNMRGNVGVLGICGVGGMGKTTLAMEVYNQQQSNFRKKCFLKNVKDMKGMDLQRKMMTALLGEDAMKKDGDYSDWFGRMRNHEILLVVDDISDTKQFYELIPDLNQLPPRSRVLITSRARDILNNIMLDVPQGEVYDMHELSFSNSLELFTWSAFRKAKLDAVDASFHANVEQITKACGGVPLALEVMGGFLADKKNTLECWSKAIFALRSNGYIMTSLKISYDGLLSNDDKCIFVDIACFMLGHPKHIALAIWDSLDYRSPRLSLMRLMEKNLVKVDGEGLLSMHDLLRDMGHTVVIERAQQESKMQSHIWDPSVAAKIIQKRQTKGLKKVLAVSLSGVRHSLSWEAESFANLRELRYLSLDGCEVDGNFSGWSEELRWLQWRHFPHKELPWNLNSPNLAVLDLSESPHLTRVWVGNFENKCPCQRLLVLILSNCPKLEELPQDIRKLVMLKFLHLNRCSSLNSLPNSLGELCNLVELELSGCELLRKLPASFSKLRELKVLRLSGTAIMELPDDFGQLSSLRSADFKDCKRLTELPVSFGSLCNLDELELSGCELLCKLPASFSELQKLKVLGLRKTAIRELPDDFGELCNLRSADFSYCKTLTKLPVSFGSLCNLIELKLSGCELLRKLPASFSKLRELKVLGLNMAAVTKLPHAFGELYSLRFADFSYCKKLTELPESFGSLGNLIELKLSGCELLCKLPACFSKLRELKVLGLSRTAISELPDDFGELCSLNSADFSFCKTLTELPVSFASLCNLYELDLSVCELLRKLPASFSKLPELKVLGLSGTAITELPDDFGELCSLNSADFSYCKTLTNLPESFGSLGNLDVLQLSGCELLRKLPASFSKLRELKVLRMSGTAITELPDDFGHLCSLKKASFDCKRLTELPESFGSLCNLDKLALSGCELLRKFPASFSKLQELKVLDLGRTAITELSDDFGQLCSLRSAYFNDCKSLTELPESFGSLCNLGELTLSGCELLRKLPASFSKLRALKVLQMSGTAITELPDDFGHLCSLRSAYFSHCKRLAELPESVGSLCNLVRLYLSGCELLRKLPASFSKLRELKVLRMSGTAITELPDDFGHLCSLKKASFDDSKRLTELPESFGSLCNLDELELSGCELLRKFPASFSKLRELKVLRMSGTAITELPDDFGHLCCLKKLASYIARG